MYCSLAIRNRKQISRANELNTQSDEQAEESEPEAPRVGRRHKLREPERLKQRTRTGRTKAVDRSEMACGSKKSIIELLRTRLGRALYYDAFVELWTQYVET